MISFLAPILAVIFGVAIVLLCHKSKPLNLKLFLAFSGAFLLSILFLDFFPEIFKTGKSNTGIFIMIGIALGKLLGIFQ